MSQLMVLRHLLCHWAHTTQATNNLMSTAQVFAPPTEGVVLGTPPAVAREAVKQKSMNTPDAPKRMSPTQAWKVAVKELLQDRDTVSERQLCDVLEQVACSVQRKCFNVRNRCGLLAATVADFLGLDPMEDTALDASACLQALTHEDVGMCINKQLRA